MHRSVGQKMRPLPRSPSNRPSDFYSTHFTASGALHPAQDYRMGDNAEASLVTNVSTAPRPSPAWGIWDESLIEVDFCPNDYHLLSLTELQA